MQSEPTTIERAFDLARSGRFPTVTLIRKQLRLEGYQDKNQLQGSALYKQLRSLIATQAGLDILPVTLPQSETDCDFPAS